MQRGGEGREGNGLGSGRAVLPQNTLSISPSSTQSYSLFLSLFRCLFVCLLALPRAFLFVFDVDECCHSCCCYCCYSTVAVVGNIFWLLLLMFSLCACRLMHVPSITFPRPESEIHLTS